MSAPNSQFYVLIHELSMDGVKTQFSFTNIISMHGGQDYLISFIFYWNISWKLRKPQCALFRINSQIVKDFKLFSCFKWQL
jgi:hypothetical protein